MGMKMVSGLRGGFVVIVFCLIAIVMTGATPGLADGPSTKPSTSPTALPDTPLIRDGKAALAANRYKDARDLFMKAIAADSKDFTAMHGAGIACLYLHDPVQANKQLEKAVSLAPVADRALSYNFAVSDLALNNYRRAAQTIRDYLYANPDTIDEPMLDALGVCLNQRTDKTTVSRASDGNRKFFSLYVANLEEKRPGMKRWGRKWLPVAEVDDRAAKVRQMETDLDLLSKDLAQSKARVDQYKQELQAAKYGHGVKSRAEAASQLSDEESAFKEKQQKYDRAAAEIDAIKPDFPQLLLPISMDATTPPPFKTVEVAVAAPTQALIQPPPQPITNTAPPTNQPPQNQPPALSNPPVSGTGNVASASSVNLNDLLKRKFAEINVSAQWAALDPNAKVYDPVNAKNVGQLFGPFPSELAGRSFTRVPMHNTMQEAKLYFSVKTDGLVIIAIQGWGGGGSGGDWEKECVNRDALIQQGWQEIPNPGGRTLFYRMCKAVESFTYRTNKYHPPLLIK